MYVKQNRNACDNNRSAVVVDRLIDNGNIANWNKTSKDYSLYRPGYPTNFFNKLASFDIGLPEQRILDLGTGTGVLARIFAKQGSIVTGVDIAEDQLNECRLLAEKQNVTLRLLKAPAEDTGLPPQSFDVITASQSWLYFDKNKIVPEVLRLLYSGGSLMTCHICWLPRLDVVAWQTESLILKFNPNWTGADWSGEILHQPTWSKDVFKVRAMFYYDELIPFTHDTWRGRIRACRGIGATLSPEEVNLFDTKHAELLTKITPKSFSVLHRINAHIFEPK